MTVLNVDRLKDLRKKNGMTQGEVAKLISMERSGYTKVEIGSRSISMEALTTLAKHFNCTTDYLLGIDSTPTQPVLNAPLTSPQHAYTDDEKELIRKFNMLDERDREDVMDIINRKLERMERRFSEEGKRA